MALCYAYDPELLEIPIRFKDVVQLIADGGMQNLIAYHTFCHIETLEALLSGSVSSLTNQLHTANLRLILSILCKSLCFRKVIVEIRTMRFQHIDHVTIFLSMQRIPNGLAVPHYEAGGVKIPCITRV